MIKEHNHFFLNLFIGRFQNLFEVIPEGSNYHIQLKNRGWFAIKLKACS